MGADHRDPQHRPATAAGDARERSRAGDQGAEARVSDRGVWLAYCISERRIDLAELRRRLGDEPDHVFRVTASAIEIAVDSRNVLITVESGQAAKASAIQLADDEDVLFGDEEPDRELLRRCDVCYRAEYDLDDVYEVYNTLMYFAGALIEACGAIVFDEPNRRFV
jgi:hypothetical protein